MARILVVDDEADMRLALSNVLTRNGHKVQEAPEGETALATLAKGAFDLMLLDMRLPGMDGIQILKRVRQNHPDLPVIMVTGYGSVDSAIEVMRLGASHYLAKPFSNKELVDSVDRIVQGRRLPVPVGGGAPAALAPDERPAPDSPAEPNLPAPVLSLPGPAAPVSGVSVGWGLALAVGVVLLAWPLVSSLRGRGRDHALTYSHPTAIAWAGDRLWSTDWFSQSVYEMQLERGGFKIVRAAALPQSHLSGLALTKEAVYVADDWRREIQRRKLDAHLTLERVIKSPGAKPSSLYFDGRFLWSADAAQGRIYQHEPDDALTVVATYPSPAKAPVAIYKDDSYFWSADGDTRLIYRHRLDSKLTVLATYEWPDVNEGSQPLSCFTMRDGVAWLGRDGLSRLLEAPLPGFAVRRVSPN
ncbi:MAG: sigma-54-dependent Fis family transcriptional regulator [Elusimicrobia bacterium]|nr:sigma-54-dependent Fis family transcriptional regulator [Elusimicrobiota bacterium]